MPRVRETHDAAPSTTPGLADPSGVGALSAGLAAVAEARPEPAIDAAAGTDGPSAQALATSSTRPSQQTARRAVVAITSPRIVTRIVRSRAGRQNGPTGPPDG